MTHTRSHWYWSPRVTRALILGVFLACLDAGALLGFLEDARDGWIWGAVAGSEVGLFSIASLPRRFFRAAAPSGDGALVARLGRLEMLRRGERFMVRAKLAGSGPDEGALRLPLAPATLWWGSYVPFFVPLVLVVLVVGVLSLSAAFAALDVVFSILLVAYPLRVTLGLLIALRLAGGAQLRTAGLVAGKKMWIDARVVASCEAQSNDLVVMLKDGTRASVAVLDATANKTMAAILREAWRL